MNLKKCLRLTIQAYHTPSDQPLLFAVLWRLSWVDPLRIAVQPRPSGLCRRQDRGLLVGQRCAWRSLGGMRNEETT
jgi:hypothetical protein